MLQRTGAWIFVSHSLRDFAGVRLVRNALEERGHFPLLFYLRCLHDSTEVDGLIRREIDARSFFLLCDSKNARDSKWVQEEISIIESRPRRLLSRLDLEWPWEDQLAVIEEVASRVNVYISSSRQDAPIADVLARHLAAADYSLVGAVEDFEPGEDLAQRIQSDIDEALRTGFVLVLLSPESVAREESLQWHEARYALSRLQSFAPNGGRVIPIILRGSSETLARLPPELRHLQAVDVSMLSIAEQPVEIVRVLDQFVRRTDA